MINASIFQQLNGYYLIQGMFDAVSDRIAFQEVSKKGCVKVISVRILYLQICQDILSVCVFRLELLFNFIVKDPSIEIPGRSLLITQGRDYEARVIVCLQILLQLQPPLGETKSIDDFIPLKWMVEVLPLRVPVDEFDRQFITRIALGHPILLIQT